MAHREDDRWACLGKKPPSQLRMSKLVSTLLHDIATVERSRNEFGDAVDPLTTPIDRCRGFVQVAIESSSTRGRGVSAEQEEDSQEPTLF
jgi:hypothetical protein